MTAVEELFGTPLVVACVGIEAFPSDIVKAGGRAYQLDWRPPAGGDAEVLASLRVLSGLQAEIAEANRQALDAILGTDPLWVDVALAGEALDLPSSRTILHAGPPVAWEEMCGPMHGAVIGACLYEGWAGTPAEAERLAATGDITFAPCHDYGAVGPMTGVLSPSMAGFVVKDSASGASAFASFNEGLGKALRFGAYGDDVMNRLRWMRAELMPVLRWALRSHGPVEVKPLVSQALQMGDECHNRNKAATALLLRDLAGDLFETDQPVDYVARVVRFIAGNEHFFLNLSMAAAKVTMDSASGIPMSTVVTAMSRNGKDFGIRVSGLGDRWFCTPAPPINGLYFPGYSEKDANPDLGDSSITETSGIGGFAMASAIPIVQFVGGTVEDAIRYTTEMYRITVGENSAFGIPTIGFRGTPTGIDVRAVLEYDQMPVINTGIAHKDPGIGQVGAGIVHAPVECFKKALRAFVLEYGRD
jgi:hypothetical protein